MSGPQFPSPTWFVGAGNMVRAMLTGWASAGIDLSRAVAIRPSGRQVPQVGRTISSLTEAGPAPKFVVLGFKPQMLDTVAPGLGPLLTSETVILSLLAGTPVDRLRAAFPTARAIVRVMPNLPVAVRRGVTALYTEDADEQLGQLLSELITALGVAVWSPNQAHLSAVGAMAGSGPAYVARFTNALAAAGTARGLDQGLATTLAIETVLGTGWLAATERSPLDELADRVASPKGTTLAGLAVLDAELPDLVARTIDAAIARGEELASGSAGAASRPG